MILIDSKNISPNIALNNLKKAKKHNSNTSFLENNKAKESQFFSESAEIANVAPMLFLQEITENVAEDRKNLEYFGHKAFLALRKLQLSLLNQKLEINDLYNLRSVIAEQKWQFSNQELENIANEISLRIEVEIAKLEVLC